MCLQLKIPFQSTIINRQSKILCSGRGYEARPPSTSPNCITCTIMKRFPMQMADPFPFQSTIYNRQSKIPGRGYEARPPGTSPNCITCTIMKRFPMQMADPFPFLSFPFLSNLQSTIYLRQSKIPGRGDEARPPGTNIDSIDRAPPPNHDQL